MKLAWASEIPRLRGANWFGSLKVLRTEREVGSIKDIWSESRYRQKRSLEDDFRLRFSKSI